MATLRVTPDADAIESEVQIAAPAERVFEALVDPAQVPQWWGQEGIYRCTEFHADLRAGGKFRTVGVDREGRRFEVTGEYVTVDRPRVLETTWVASWTGKVETKVRWELETTKQGTLVRIRHSGLATHPEVKESYRGWPRMLEWLQGFLERGETVKERKAGSWK